MHYSSKENVFNMMDLKNYIDILFMFSLMVNNGFVGPCNDLTHLRDFNDLRNLRDLRDYVYQVSFL